MSYILHIIFRLRTIGFRNNYLRVIVDVDLALVRSFVES